MFSREPWLTMCQADQGKSAAGEYAADFLFNHQWLDLSWDFHLQMSLQWRPWEIGSVWAERVGQGSMAMSGLSFRKALFGTGWAISFLLCMIGLRKQSSQLGPSFLALKVFHSLNSRLLAKNTVSYVLLVCVSLFGLAFKLPSSSYRLYLRIAFPCL